MRFIKENLFLVIIIAAVAVLGGLILAAHFSIAKDVDESIAQRQKTTASLENLSRVKANEEMVRTQQRRVESIRQAASRVKQECVEWNKRNYEVLELPTRTGSVKAFPLDREVTEFDYSFEFTGQYRASIERMLRTLNPTAPPSQDEIDAHVEQWENQLMQEQEVKAERGKTAQQVGTPARWGAPSFGDAQGYAQQNVSAEAKGRGVQSAVISKARAGEIYVGLSSLDVMFPSSMTGRRIPELWQAQLNLWVTGDVLEAIRKTNDQVFTQYGLEDSDRNVFNAAVKRLVRLDIDEAYVLPPSDTDGGYSPSPSPVGPGGGVYEHQGEMMREKMMMESASAMPAASEIPSRSKAATGLTKRGSNRMHDVLQYNFCVIMSSRYLADLQRNLLRENLHTILDVTISSVDRIEQADRSVSDADQENFYYYGPDPVVVVAIRGELLLLTDWVRGSYNEPDRQWERPPLIPAEALKQFVPQQALRPEDVSRIEESAPAQGPYGADMTNY